MDYFVKTSLMASWEKNPFQWRIAIFSILFVDWNAAKSNPASAINPADHILQDFR